MSYVDFFSFFFNTEEQEKRGKNRNAERTKRSKLVLKQSGVHTNAGTDGMRDGPDA